MAGPGFYSGASAARTCRWTGYGMGKEERTEGMDPRFGG